jgi:hypothetical protein
MQQSNTMCVAIMNLFDKPVKSRDVLQIRGAANGAVN